MRELLTAGIGPGEMRELLDAGVAGVLLPSPTVGHHLTV